MIDFEIMFNDERVELLAPYSSESSLELAQENLRNTLHSEGSMPVALPPGLVFVGPGESVVVFERPPRYQDITVSSEYKDSANASNSKTFNVALPWQVYVGEFGSNGNLLGLCMYFTTEPVGEFYVPADHFSPGSSYTLTTRNGNSLWQAPLMNIYPNNAFCLADREETYSTNMFSKVSSMERAVWGSFFNTDLTEHVNNWTNFIEGKGIKIPTKHHHFGPWNFYEYWASMDIETMLEQTKQNRMFRQVTHHIQFTENFQSPTEMKFFSLLASVL